MSVKETSMIDLADSESLILNLIIYKIKEQEKAASCGEKNNGFGVKRPIFKRLWHLTLCVSFNKSFHPCGPDFSFVKPKC